jgi:hypothetical protein
MAPNAAPSATEAGQSGGVHKTLTRYFVRRSPAALLTDAVMLFVISVAASHLWTALAHAATPEYRSTAAESLVAAIVTPQTIAGTINSACFYGAWLLAGWAAVRHLGAALMSGSETRSVQNDPGRPE